MSIASPQESDPSEGAPGRSNRRRFWCVFALGYLGLIFVCHNSGSGLLPDWLSAGALQLGAPAGWVTDAVLGMLLAVTSWLVLGFSVSAAVVFCFPVRSRVKFGLSALAGWALSASSMYAIISSTTGPPNVATNIAILLVTGLGSLIGATFARANSLASWLANLSIALISLMVFALIGGFLLGLSDDSTRDPATRLSTEDRRRLTNLIRSSDPRFLAANQIGTIRLSDRDASQLSNWMLSLVPGDHRARIHFSEGRFVASASLKPEVMSSLNRHVSFEFGGSVSKQWDAWLVSPDRVRVGPIGVPEWLLRLSGPFKLDRSGLEQESRALFDAVEKIRFSDRAVQVAYRRVDIQGGMLNAVLTDFGLVEDLETATGVYAQRLIEFVESRSDPVTTEDCLRVVFSEAVRRSQTEDPVRENSDAMLALGYLLGHHRLRSALGPDLPRPSMVAAGRFRQVSLYGRGDWSKHFALSAALTILSNKTISMDVGLLKEELDADRGSGFSFADLMADRAGTRLAQLATESEASARYVQRRLAGHFGIGDVVPDPTGLPEGLYDDQLKSRYGGVGGRAYKLMVRGIDRRIEACSIYAK